MAKMGGIASNCADNFGYKVNKNENQNRMDQ